MRIQDRSVGPITVLEVDGSLPAGDEQGRLKTAVDEALRRGSLDVVLDLTHVGYVGSTRLGALITAHVAVARAGGRLKLASVPPRVVELLRTAGLESVFERFESVAAATSHLQET